MVACVLGGICCAFAGAPVPDVLKQNCSSCHSDKVRTSGFSVDSIDGVLRGGNKHGQAVIAGHPEGSPLVKLLKGELAPRMPVGRELPAQEIAGIENWIRSLPPSTGEVAKSGWRWPYEK